MSRKGKQPVPVPKGVEVTVAGNVVSVKGSKGTLSQEVKPMIGVAIEDDVVMVSLKKEDPKHSKWHGLYRTLIENMVIGVSQGFEKSLEMIGVGYRAAVQGNLLDVQVGLSHPTKLPIPEGVQVKIDKGTKILVSGINKQVVGQFAADIRSVRPPEPYQGKGIRYKDEYVRRKSGKAAGK